MTISLLRRTSLKIRDDLSRNTGSNTAGQTSR
jgi:hypothetical protein